MDWHKNLCGIPVTPESWIGGILEFIATGEFEDFPGQLVANLLDPKMYSNPQKLWDKLLRNYRPVFPPKGWAGLSDHDLWEVVYGGGPVRFLNLFEVWESRVAILAGKQTDITKGLGSTIQALKNAQILSKRFTDETV